MNLPGGALPIISITEALNFTAGLLTGGNDLTNLDDFFAHFVPLPNSTLIDQQIGHYPFANQSVAANAVIPQPLTISLRMICPARGPGGYALKLATITALQATLKQHNISGGTYIVATPSAFYPNCVMLDLKDTSAGFDVQAQNTYQWDFEAPLLTLQDAQAAQNNLLSQITAGAPINGLPAWSAAQSYGGQFREPRLGRHHSGRQQSGGIEHFVADVWRWAGAAAMTTFTNFTPNQTSAFQFTTNLDGAAHTADDHMERFRQHDST